MINNSRILVVGAGFSGAVLARELAQAGHRVLVIDSRPHLAGNSHTERHVATGIMEHVYGPHIFNTSNIEVWNYIQRFCVMGPYMNRVQSNIKRGIFSMPINLHTINQFFGLKLNPREARDFIASKGDRSIVTPRNFEEQALKFIGRELYEAFFYGYTKKQWGCEPSELPADILKRLPVRFNYETNYYGTRYQGIPLEGYTAIIEQILADPNIEVKLETPWSDSMRGQFGDIFFTGPLDAFYGYRFGRLGYRTVYFERMVYEGDYQGNPVINYPDIDIPFTRVHEHKHFTPWEEHAKTLVLTEYSKETGKNDTPYYPKRLSADLGLLERYKQLGRIEENVFFVGRLATYRYLDMHVVIAEALEFSRRYLKWKTQPGSERPVFSDELMK